MEYIDFDSQFWLNTNDRRNIRHFNYFACKNILGFLQSFTAVAEISDCAQYNPGKIQAPAEYFSHNAFYDIGISLRGLIEYFEDDCCFSPEDASMLASDLHMLMNVLPYLNERHYPLSRYEYENFPSEMWCSFDGLRNLDRTLAKRIAPVLRDFSQCSQFPPSYFSRMYSYPKADPYLQKEYETCSEWRKTLTVMADAWDWLASRDNVTVSDKWEFVPDKVYYGLHLFAEYLSDMQNN